MRFKYLNRFETALNQLERKFGWLNAKPVSKVETDASKQTNGYLIWFRRHCFSFLNLEKDTISHIVINVKGLGIQYLTC